MKGYWLLSHPHDLPAQTDREPLYPTSNNSSLAVLSRISDRGACSVGAAGEQSHLDSDHTPDLPPPEQQHG